MSAYDLNVVASNLFIAGNALEKVAKHWSDNEQEIFEKFQEETNGSYEGGSLDDLAYDFKAISRFFKKYADNLS